jgi:hypothetical protein
MGMNDPRDLQDVYDRDEIRLAFAVFRDRFPELTDSEFEQQVVNKAIARLFRPIARSLSYDMDDALRRDFLAFLFRE